MTKGATTKEILLAQAIQLFWARGYSNVSVREVAKAAGVDVALIARYYGSKLGLFEATLDTLQPLDPEQFSDGTALVEMLVHMYSTADRSGNTPSPITLILVNANDPDVGDLVTRRQYENWQSALEVIIGDKTRAALFFAALMGFSIVDKYMHMSGIAQPGTTEYERQLRYCLTSALEYSGA